MNIVPFTLSSTEDTANGVYAACMWITSDNGDSEVVVFRRGTDGHPMLGISDSPERALRLHSMVTPLRIEWCDDTNRRSGVSARGQRTGPVVNGRRAEDSDL